MRAAVGVTVPVKNGERPAVVSAGYLRTPTGVRVFNVPTPFQPITKAVSYFVDLSFDKNVPPSVTAVEGVVATAGEHGLKIANGKLAETDDGWTTWTDVEDPPTGPLQDLAGAMCSDHGCVVGAWTRLGWSK